MRDATTHCFSEAHDPVQRISYPFPYDLLVAMGLICLLPLYQPPRETGRYNGVLQVETLRLLLPHLAVVMSLCISVARSSKRSVAARIAAAVIVFVVAGLSVPPMRVLWISLAR